MPAAPSRRRPPVLSLIGDTPLVPLHFPEADRTLYAKAEFFNPSGANVAAALQVARTLGPDSQVVTVLCDRAERYYPTKLFCE